jgi:hypothetical protein
MADEVVTVSEEVEAAEPQELSELEEGQAPEEGEAPEAAEPAGEEEGKGQKHLLANERIQQLIAERNEDREKLAALEEKFHAMRQEAPDFVEVDYQAVNRYLQESEDKIVELKADGKFFEAAQLQKRVDNLLGEIETNETKRKAWNERKRSGDNERASAENRLATLTDAATFYQREMKIPPETWNTLGDVFAKACQKDPVLGREFAERVDTMTPTAVVRWAHEYTVKNLVKGTAGERQAAKERTGKGATGGNVVNLPAPKTYDELMNLSAKERNQVFKHNRKLFNKLCANAG